MSVGWGCEMGLASSATDGLLDRRGFLAAAAAASLAGCKRGPAPVRILYGDAAGSTSYGVLQIFARTLAKFGVSASVEVVSRGTGKLAAQMLAEGPRDGSLIGQLITGLIYAQIMGEKAVHPELAAYEWIGNYAADSRVLAVSAKAGVSDFRQLLSRAEPITIPANSARASIAYEAAVVRHITGARIKVIPGFKGGARTLAVISGEVDGMLGTLDAMTSVLDLPGSRILLRVSSASLPAGTPGVSPQGVPTLREMSRGRDAAPLIQLMDAYSQLGRMMALPPGTPADIVALWRQRFYDVISDPEFRAQLAKLRVGIHYRSGPTVAAQLKALTARQAEIAPALARALDS